MIPLEFIWTLQDIAIVVVLGLIIGGTVIYFIVKGLTALFNRMFKWKAYAQAYDDAPNMLLDRKWGVRYKKHFWNHWKPYEDPKRKYTHDYLRYEAYEVAEKIRNGKIKV